MGGSPRDQSQSDSARSFTEMKKSPGVRPLLTGDMFRAIETDFSKIIGRHDGRARRDVHAALELGDGASVDEKVAERCPADRAAVEQRVGVDDVLARSPGAR